MMSLEVTIAHPWGLPHIGGDTMKRNISVFLIAILILGTFPLGSVSAVASGLSIIVDGNLDEWPTTLLLDDPIGDGKWGSGDDIKTVGAYSDGTYIYIAAVFKKTGYNNLGVLIDVIGKDGAPDTKGHPWNRHYTFARGDIDMMIESWEFDLSAWTFSPTGVNEVTSSIQRAYGSKDGWVIAEMAIPLSVFGDIQNPSFKVVFVLTGGSNGALQWFADVAPDQDVPGWNNGGGAPAPAILTKFLFWSYDSPYEFRVVGENFDYNKYLLEKKANHIASFISLNSFYGQIKFKEYYSRYDEIKNELAKYYLSPEVQEKIAEYDSEVNNLLELYNEGIKTINLPGRAFIGAFRVYRAYTGMKKITSEIEKILEDAQKGVYELEGYLQELSKNLTKTIDGNLDDWSVPPVAVDEAGYGQDGADLKALYVDYDDQFLYIALTTENRASWRIAYGISLDYKDGGYTGDQDSWGKKVSFSRGIDAQLYFFWNGEFFGDPGTSTITSAQLVLWNGTGWEYKDLQLVGFYAYTGGAEDGLQTLEIAIPWEALGVKPGEINIVAYVTGQGAGDSAVDSLPLQDAVKDTEPGQEWGDADTFTQFATVTTE